MSLNTEKLRDRLEGEFPVDVAGIYLDRKGVRIQYREQYGDEGVDRQLRKSQLREIVNSFIKQSAYMDSNLERNSKMMLQLDSGKADIFIQRVAANNDTNKLQEYRIRQDIIRSSDDLYIFSTKYYPIESKQDADNKAHILREHVCADSERKFILELQHLSASKEYMSIARFHTRESYSSIMDIQTLA